MPNLAYWCDSSKCGGECLSLSTLSARYTAFPGGTCAARLAWFSVSWRTTPCAQRRHDCRYGRYIARRFCRAVDRMCDRLRYLLHPVGPRCPAQSCTSCLRDARKQRSSGRLTAVVPVQRPSAATVHPVVARAQPFLLARPLPCLEGALPAVPPVLSLGYSRASTARFADAPRHAAQRCERPCRNRKRLSLPDSKVTPLILYQRH